MEDRTKAGERSRDTSRRSLVESMRLEDHQRMEEDSLSPEHVLRGTWTHPNPSLIYLYNPRLWWRFRIIMLVIVFCIVMAVIIRHVLLSS
jgi:hypothetical protein